MSIRTLCLTSVLAASAGLVAGCYRPHGALMSYSGGAQTYYSTEMQPKTVRVLDLRTGEVIFSMDIPVGKQLTLDFSPGEGDDPVYSPDLMQYEIFDMGTMIGKLHNAMSVPSSNSRRVDIYMRPSPEYMTAAPERMLRTDELEDRPEWWTPEGGELPEDGQGGKMYDQ